MNVAPQRCAFDTQAHTHTHTHTHTHAQYLDFLPRAQVREMELDLDNPDGEDFYFGLEQDKDVGDDLD
jgi:hypothetical protein